MFDLPVIKKHEAVICDFDGTLTYNNANRDPYDFIRSIEDEPNLVICDLIRTLGLIYDLILLSGRSEKYLSVYLEWLQNQKLDFSYMYLREEEDLRPSIEVKEELLLNNILPCFNPVLAFDDDENVCEQLWKKNNILYVRVF